MWRGSRPQRDRFGQRHHDICWQHQNCTTLFSVVNAVLLRPLPYNDPARLVVPTNLSKDTFFGWRVGDFQYAGWRDQSAIFDDIAAYAGQQHTITANGEPEQLKTQAVTPRFLRMLGVAPIIGRDFTDSDAGKRGGQVALISYSLWQQRFSGDPAVLSKSMALDGKLYSIAGVLPRDFRVSRQLQDESSTGPHGARPSAQRPNLFL